MKIITDIQQGTEAWVRYRLGRPTASMFHKVVTPVQAKLSAQAKDYALKLVAERLLRMPTDGEISTGWMERGKELEPAAVRQYEFANDVETFPVGFIVYDEKVPFSMGCSPDRIVLAKSQEKIAIEVKCKSPPEHLRYCLFGAGDDYKPQVQGQLFIAELDRVDLYSYHPMMPPATIRTFRDDEYIEKLSAALFAFVELVANLEEKAKALGVYQAVAERAPDSELSEMQQQVERDADRLFSHGVGA